MDRKPQRKNVPVIEVLRACRDFHDRAKPGPREFHTEKLARYGPEKVVTARLEQLDGKGLIECGVSLRTAWLTDKGREHLAALESAEVTG